MESITKMNTPYERFQSGTNLKEHTGTLRNMTEEFDIIIKNATIVDGVHDVFRGSIGIVGERIKRLAISRGTP